MLDRMRLRSKAPPRADEPVQDAALLKRILAYEPDRPGGAMPFSKRLAEENGWTAAYARRVVDEYKRFIYLACISTHEVTPSDEIDQAWHLHLTYSRDYWQEFCEKVLERPLHHDPTDGGTSDDARFKFNYERTLSLYKEVFRTAPPPSIWPPAAIRFAYGARLKRVNLGIFDISPKKNLSADRGARIIAPIIIAFMAVMLSAATIPFKPVWDAGSVLWAIAGTFGMAYALWRLLGHFVVNVLKSKSSSFADRNPVNRMEHGHYVTFTTAGANVGGYAWLPDIAIEIGSNGVGVSSNSGGGGGFGGGGCSGSGGGSGSCGDSGGGGCGGGGGGGCG